MVLPTYLVDPPDPMPRFYEEDRHQGVQRRLYPYPVNDALTRRREDRTYRMVYLENDYIQVVVIPEIGGRVFSALDKTNGYDFFYRQHIIKPGLIGMNGAWISGGIEWGFPHHHGPDVHAPVGWAYTENDDGSATVWIANIDRLYRMRVLINQFYNASADPYPYYEEALRRDPGDSRVNTQLGILYCKRKMWTEAEGRLRLALERVAGNYPRPRVLTWPSPCGHKAGRMRPTKPWTTPTAVSTRRPSTCSCAWRSGDPSTPWSTTTSGTTGPRQAMGTGHRGTIAPPRSCHPTTASPSGPNRSTS